METGSVLSFVCGAAYIILGLFLTMIIDLNTNRVERFARNNDYAIFALLLVWPLAIPILFLPRYGHRKTRSGL